MSDNMTTETQHTPGEWTIQPDGKSAYFLPIVDDRGCYICAVSERTDAGEAKANANLIAAAPELLKAAQYAGMVLRAFISANPKGHSVGMVQAVIELQDAANKALAR